MTNAEKYKTAAERTEAFYRFCHNQSCSDIDASCKREKCVLEWLELESDVDGILPCPFCGGEVVLQTSKTGERERYFVGCSNEDCMYDSGYGTTMEEAVKAHNRLAVAANVSAIDNDNGL